MKLQRRYYNSFFNDTTSERPQLPKYPRGLLYNEEPLCMEDDRLCNPFFPYYNNNIVKDYRVLENEQDPGNVSLRQNINVKHARLENNSSKDVLVGIDITRNPYEAPLPKFLLRGGEVRDLAVNMPGERMQYIWLYDPLTKRRLNEPHPMLYHINTFVINEGLNLWWIMDFGHNGYRPQF